MKTYNPFKRILKDVCFWHGLPKIHKSSYRGRLGQTVQTMSGKFFCPTCVQKEATYRELANDLGRKASDDWAVEHGPDDALEGAVAALQPQGTIVGDSGG